MTASSRIRLARLHRGNTTLLVVCALLALVAIGGVVYWTMFREGQTAATGPILNEVSKAPFENTVLEQGEVEPASAIELRCEVKSRSGGGGGSTTIIEIVPEGTFVKGPRPEAPKGDLLVKLDAQALKIEQQQQQIKVNTSESLVLQAQKAVEVAALAHDEYKLGTYAQESSVIDNEIFVAEQSLLSAKLAQESSQRLAAKGLLSSLQLDGAKFAFDKAGNDLANAQQKKQVLDKYTSVKMLKQLESDKKTAESKLSVELISFKLEQDKLKEIEEQIEKCVIYAPQDGQVVYVNKFNMGRSGSSAEFVVEAGAQVREAQPIIKLPNSNAMQIKALINEARVTLVSKDMPVTIRVDALKDELIKGEVTKVNQYAEPGNWSGGNIKKYAAFILVQDPPAGLRSGMNAEVRIHIERQPEALQIPVQALAEYRGKYFVVKKSGELFETQEVDIGSTNDKTAVIEKGLAEKDQVVMNPRNSTMLKLPDLPEPTVVNEVKLNPAAKAALANPTATKGAPPVAGGPPGSGGPPGAGTAGGPPGAGGGEGGRGRGGPGGRGGFNAASMVARALENDADKDGKLSMAEIANIDERGRQRTIDADENKDGFVDKAELTKSSEALIKMIQDRGGFGGGGGPPGGGPGAGQ